MESDYTKRQKADKEVQLKRLIDHKSGDHACFEVFTHTSVIRGFCRQVVEALMANRNVEGMTHSPLICGEGTHHFYGVIELWKREEVLAALTEGGFSQEGPAGYNPCVSYHQWSVTGDKELVQRVLSKEQG